jgi:hypothetical protein
MPSYIAESYLSRARREELSSQATRARDAATSLASDGQPVAYLRTAFIPEDEICLHWFIAPSPAAVTEIARLAKLEFDRVIEEVEHPPHQSDRNPTRNTHPAPGHATAISQANNHRGGTRCAPPLITERSHG